MAKDEFADVMMALNGFGCRIRACGSKVTNTPPPPGADNDFIVLVPEAVFLPLDHYLLTEAGYDLESERDSYMIAEAPGENAFASYRKEGPTGEKADSINLLLVTDPAFYERHAVATALLRRLNLPSKDDRIAVSYAVLYGKEWKA